MQEIMAGNFKMADDKKEDKLSHLEDSKEQRVLNESSSTQETKCSTLIQSSKISSQFASPLYKRSSPDTNQAEQSFHIKRARPSHKDDDNESCKRRNETKELENILRKKEDTLRKLKLVKMYRAKNNLPELEELIGKWRSICQEAVQDLYEKFNKDNNTLTLGQFLDGLRVTHDLIRYSEEDETFY